MSRVVSEDAPTEVRRLIARFCHARGISLWSVSVRIGAGRGTLYHKGDMTVRKLAEIIGEIEKAQSLTVEECNELLEVLGVPA